MKYLAWGMVLVSAGFAAAEGPAKSSSTTKTSNAKATQESVGASGKETQSQPAVKTVSATTVTPTSEHNKVANTKEAAKTAAVPVPLHKHPVMVTMLNRSNGIRARVGLRAHRLNPALCQAAQNHAEYMAATGSFSHDTNLGYVGRARRFGFRGGVRENIGWNYANVDSAFAGWQGSGGHYAAIASSETTEAGFGYAKSRNGQTYWVSVYGAATAADDADAKAVIAREAERAEAAKLAAEEAADGDDSKVVPASAETEVQEAKPSTKTEPTSKTVNTMAG